MTYLGKKRNAYRIGRENKEKRSLGRHTRGCNDVKMDIKET
jgi:hypothetical protein